jgi:hypothetical protein
MMKRKVLVSGPAVIASPPPVVIAGLVEQSQNVAAAVYPRYTHTVSMNMPLRHYSPTVGSGSRGKAFLWMKHNRAVGRCPAAFIRTPGRCEPHTTASGTVGAPGVWPSGPIPSAEVVTGFHPRAAYRWVYG